MSSGGGYGLQIRQRVETSLVSSILTRLRHFLLPTVNPMESSNAEEVIVGFEGVSQAIMAEQALLEQGFYVRVMPMPAGIRAGCGFCLRFLPADLTKATAFLAERGLAIKEAWVKSPDGKSYRKAGIDGKE